ncbi:MAG: helix-turn-helix transcriptional regulator [Ferruginibacter sp.]
MKQNNNRLFIKNMVCPRCISTVESILEKQEIPGSKVSLGEVELTTTLTASQLMEFDTALKKVGFELIETRINKIVSDIKKIVLQYINDQSADKKLKLSSFITKQIHNDYSYLSDLFSSVEGITIEQFFIVQRIEKVKELLVYEELSLTEIAYQTGFSSVAHLSAQFKKTTGLTASHFKKVGERKRKSIG